MRRLVVVGTTAVALTLPTEAGGHRLPHKPFKQMSDERKVRYLKRQEHHARSAIGFWERRRSPHFSSSLRARDLRFHRVSLRIASRNRRALELKILVRAVESDWLAAVRFAGRFFGSSAESWLRACSQTGSEGGWGRWVPNTEGSGAGGWLQFMLGTFNGNVDAAFAEARRRGMPLRARWRSWYSRPGQAITGAYMFGIGQRGQWTGWAC